MLPSATAIDLAERFENEASFLHSETPTSIDDRILQHDLILSKLTSVVRIDAAPAEDLAFGRELDSITDDIKKYLTYPELVTLDPRRDVLVHYIVEFKPLGDCHRRDQLVNIFNERPSVEPLKFQLHHTGVDLGQIEDVIDDHEEAVGAGLNGIREIPLLLAKRRVL
jgi:hypothetical protein